MEISLYSYIYILDEEIKNAKKKNTILLSNQSTAPASARKNN